MPTVPKKSATETLNEIVTVRIELRDTEPLIWREVDVPTSVTLIVLHDIVQTAFGWQDYHLWEFSIGKQRYGLPTTEDSGIEPAMDARKIRLRDVLNARKTNIDYTYDFGDGWEHRLTVTRKRSGTPDVAYPHYIGGEWNGPPEDCGGVPGFYQLLVVLADANHPEHAQMVEWSGKYDAKKIDIAGIGHAFSKIATRVNSAAKRQINKKPVLDF